MGQGMGNGRHLTETKNQQHPSTVSNRSLHVDRLIHLVRWMEDLHGDQRGSQAAIAKLLGISPSRLSRLMSGANETVPLRTVEAIAQNLGIRMEYFRQADLPVEGPHPLGGEWSPADWLIDSVPHHTWAGDTGGDFIASMARAAVERGKADESFYSGPIVEMIASELVKLEPFATAFAIMSGNEDTLPGSAPTKSAGAARAFVNDVADLFEWLASVSKMSNERRRLDMLIALQSTRDSRRPRRKASGRVSSRPPGPGESTEESGVS